MHIKAVTALVDAARNGNVEAVKVLITIGTDVNALSWSGENAIVVAAEHGHLDCLKELAAVGDIEATGDDERNAYSAAVAASKLECVRFLLGFTSSEDAERLDAPLELAAKTGSLDSISLLLKNGVEYESGMKALSVAARFGKLQCLKALLAHLVKVKFAGVELDLSNALMNASGNGHVACCKALLDAGANVNAEYEAGYTPLMYAAHNGCIDVIKLLVAHGANVVATDESNRSALYFAVESRDTDCLKLILRLQAEHDDFRAHPLEFQKFIHPALLFACGDYPKMLRTFIEAGADVNYEVKYSDTTVLWAIKLDCISCLLILLESGANPEANAPGDCPPLFAAVRARSLAAVKLLLKFGADPDALYRKDRAIHMAASNNDVDCLKALVEGGASLDAENYDYELPLMCSSTAASIEVLLRAGASLEMRTSLGQTPLMKAVERDNAIAVKVLLEHGANTEARENSTGRTVLIAAAAAGSESCVSLLLESGANIEAYDQQGRTALVWAAINDAFQCVRILLSRGANCNVKDSNENRPLRQLERVA